MFLPSCLRLSLTALTVHFPSAFSIITTPTESTTQNQQQQSTISGQACVGTYVFLQIAGRFECLNTPTCWALVRFLSRVNPAMTLQCITRCEWFATAVEATSVGTITSVWALMYLWHTHKLQIVIASHNTCFIAGIWTHTQPLNNTWHRYTSDCTGSTAVRVHIPSHWRHSIHSQSMVLYSGVRTGHCPTRSILTNN